MQCLLTFAAVGSSKLSKRFKSEQEPIQDDFGVWINRLQFFLSENGTIVVGIILYLDLNCARNPQPPDARLCKADLENRGFAFTSALITR